MSEQPTGHEGSPFDDGELYDVLVSGLNYGVDFYVEPARKARGPVLEVACGTGRILLACLQNGVDVDGLDLFEPMLACLRKKAAALQLTPRLYQADTRVFEGETRDPRTGARLRMYDTRTFNRVEQTQLSLFEVEMVGADGSITVHRSQFSTRYTYKTEMALLLRVAGFRRWEILGGFDGRPLTQETDSMIVFAWPDAEAGVAAEKPAQSGASQLERLD